MVEEKKKRNVKKKDLNVNIKINIKYIHIKNQYLQYVNIKL